MLTSHLIYSTSKWPSPHRWFCGLNILCTIYLWPRTPRRPGARRRTSAPSSQGSFREAVRALAVDRTRRSMFQGGASKEACVHLFISISLNLSQPLHRPTSPTLPFSPSVRCSIAQLLHRSVCQSKRHSVSPSPRLSISLLLLSVAPTSCVPLRLSFLSLNNPLCCLLLLPCSHAASSPAHECRAPPRPLGRHGAPLKTTFRDSSTATFEVLCWKTPHFLHVFMACSCLISAKGVQCCAQPSILNLPALRQTA